MKHPIEIAQILIHERLAHALSLLASQGAGVLLCCLCSLQCASPSSPTPSPKSPQRSSAVWVKTNAEGWSFTSLEDDPLASHRPAVDEVISSDLLDSESALCEGWWVESGLLEVSTQRCDYFSASYPMSLLDEGLPRPLRMLSETSPLLVKGGVTHDVLTGDELGEEAHFEGEVAEPLKAHLAVFFAQRVIWEAEIRIPSPSGYLAFQVELSSDDLAQLNTLVPHQPVFTLHLHNHGANQWRWLPLQVGFSSDSLGSD